MSAYVAGSWRLKVVREMADGVVDDVRSELAGVACVDEDKQAAWVRGQLDEKLLRQAPEHWNDDAKLVRAVPAAARTSFNSLRRLSGGRRGRTPRKVSRSNAAKSIAVERREKYRGRTLRKLSVFVGTDESRPRRGRELDIPWASRGPAATGSWIFRGVASRPRRGRELGSAQVQTALALRNEATSLSKMFYKVRDKEPAALAEHADLVVYMLEFPQFDARRHAVETFGKLEAAARAGRGAALVAKLEHDQWQYRQAAVQALGTLEAKDLAQHDAALVAKLEDAQSSVREAAAETLGKLGAAALARHGAALAAKLEDSDLRVRRVALKTLGELEVADLALYEEAVAKMARADDEKYMSIDFGDRMDIRQAAWLVMHKLKPGAGYDVYEAKLNENDRGVRLETVKALGELDAAALAPHEQALAQAAEEDRVSAVRRAAEEALAKLRVGK